ncbi:MAG: metallophosphoesterase [Hyphomonas sp.]
MKRTVIVGDVHGMLAPVRTLLDALQLVAGDVLVFAGDLVDKGPDSPGVLDLLAELSREAVFELVFVDGNHDDRHRRYQSNLSARLSVAREQASDAPELPALDAAVSDAGRAFLNAAVPFYRVKGQDVLVVHGGIPGDMEAFPESVEAAEALTGKARERFRKVLRTRYIDRETGGFVALGKEAPGDPFWAQLYDGRFGHVVFGHNPFLDGPKEFPHATGIDTGAVHGGGLTALVILEEGRRHFVRIPTETHVPKR